MAFESYCKNLYGSKMLGDLSLVLIVADVGASGAVTLDASDSSPDTTITLSTTGQSAVTYPKCQTVFLLGAHSTIAEAVGSQIQFEALDPSAGTGSFETALTTAGATAAEPASGTRFYIALLCGAN
jgi:hypothetical protein